VRLVRYALAAVLLLASTAGATAVDCRDAILGGGARHAQAAMKAVAACERRRSPDCHADARTIAKVARATARLDAVVAQRCCGADRVCGTADDESLAAIGWEAGYCPNLDRDDCNNLITSPGDVADCLACIGRAAADDLAAITTIAVAPGSALERCAVTVVKESARLAVATSKALARCWTARSDGAHANACPTPGDGTAGFAISAATTRATAAICKACGGIDRACGGDDDVAPAALGFPATCPAVAGPGGSSCGGPIATLGDLVACATCLASRDAECSGDAAAPAFLAYPTQCAAPPGTCASGVECTSAADCPAGHACLDNGSGTTRYCVGPTCSGDGDCAGGAVCRQYCTFAGCAARRCVCPGFGCGADEVCIDDGGLACRQLCTQDSDCPPPLGVCVNSTFAAGLCISSSPCE
jgi:hypothetical protein